MLFAPCMQMGEGKVRQSIKDRIAEFVYFFYKRGIIKNKIKVYSVEETLDLLLNTEKSLVRFGDGEISMIRGRNLQLQKSEPALIEDLKRILRYDNEDLMVSLPDIFDGVEQYRAKSRQFWKDHLLFSRRVYEEYCNTDRIYCNAFVSRCYFLFEDKTSCAKWFEKVRRVWADKHVVVVEGEKSHNGVGNDLLALALDVERIIGPSSNAYCKLDEIKAVCMKYPKDRLFLVALGAAAKPLTETLFYEGYRVIDIGNLDMEYEWFLQGAQKKEKLAKHELIGIEANERACYFEYLDQIKARIV